MRLGIDAANIRAGGGVTHLVELLRAADPLAYGFSQVTVWSAKATLDRIEDRPWLVKSHQPMIERGLLQRVFWQRFKLSRLARESACTVLFVPGGSYAGDFHPMVTMSQNLLPFEWRELRRYGWTWITLKMLLLRWTQSQTFRQANGLIFLTQYAQNEVMRVVNTTVGQTTIIPHGIDGRFASSPREQRAISRYSLDHPFRILYVSIIDVYKHQWHVAEAVAKLRECGLPVVLDLVGPANSRALERLRQTLDRVDPAGKFVSYSGPVPHAELHARYALTDLFLFASSCETFGQILVEAMSSGLPIACSKRSAMSELLGDAGMYFDPEDSSDIYHAVRELIESPELRARLANASFERAQLYSWRRCADETFKFLAEMVRR